jgi:cation diffusion facilitator CzcD-associated flavoprotein CzcO
MKIAIVGAGFSGIGMAIQLLRDGQTDFTIFERADELGGVWHHNTYPGIACDVPSYLYQYSFEQRKDWKQPCPPGDEIAAYLRDVADSYGVVPHIRFGTEITESTWNEESARWTLAAADGSTHEAEALVLGCGQLHRPRWPEIEGMDEFSGHAFHSAQWDHDYDLTGKRIACIGTGASAIQFVPPVAEQAAHLDVYQRTAPWMLPRKNPEYPKWMLTMVQRVPGVHQIRRAYLFLWMEMVISGLTRYPPIRKVLEAWSHSFMKKEVDDPELLAKITPDYPLGCKRVLFSSYYLEALARPNVELITDRIEKIVPEGVQTDDGTVHEVDAIIWGTGFKTNDFIAPMAVHGRDGAELNQAWAAGAEAHLGITVAGFPNLFLMYGPNTNVAVGTIIYMLESQIGYIADALRVLRDRRARSLEVRADVQKQFNDGVQRQFQESIWTNCNSWYRQAGSGKITNNWPDHMQAYRKATKEVDLDEYDLVA